MGRILESDQALKGSLGTRCRIPIEKRFANLEVEKHADSISIVPQQEM
jgi:hypothetical protein